MNSIPLHKEESVATAIEQQTAKLASYFFCERQWLPWVTRSFKDNGKKAYCAICRTSPFLLLGVYDKLVKLEGHDKEN